MNPLVNKDADLTEDPLLSLGQTPTSPVKPIHTVSAYSAVRMTSLRLQYVITDAK